MDVHEISNFIKEIDTLISFFSEMAAKEEELLAFGMYRATKWETYVNSKDSFIDFDSRIFELLKLARATDRNLADSIYALVENSKVADLIGKLNIRLRIEEKKNSPTALANAFKRFILNFSFISRFYRHKKLFAEEVISIQDILVTLNRLTSLTKRLEIICYEKWRSDDEIFKPSGLDNEKIVVFIDNALIEISQSSILPPNERKTLTEYLEKAKSELASNRPEWNKIIGVLIIVSALISGVADVSKAFDNVNSAIKYIIGRSVERHLPAIPLIIDKSLPQNPGDTFTETG